MIGAYASTIEASIRHFLGDFDDDGECVHSIRCSTTPRRTDKKAESALYLFFSLFVELGYSTQMHFIHSIHSLRMK